MHKLNRIPLHVLLVTAAFFYAVLAACTGDPKTDARTAVDVTKQVCVVAPVITGSSEVKEICAAADALAPIFERLLQAQNKAGAGSGEAQTCVATPAPGTFVTKE